MEDEYKVKKCEDCLHFGYVLGEDTFICDNKKSPYFNKKIQQDGSCDEWE